jgi:glyoxylase-like metal-dependent hydrolase (beta-lactamase superfamily II)
MQVPWGSDGPDALDRDRKHWERIRSVASNATLPPLTHVVRHGDTISLGGRSFSVVHSPGHTADHICFYERESGLFIGGDCVLPSITPHISGLGAIHDPLRAFYDSLDSILELGPLCRCLPAHGDTFDDVEGRVCAIKDHHSERLNTLTAITKQRGPASVGELSRSLFRERSWGIMAESETYAHLEHLRLQGRVECQRRKDGVLLYVA